MRGPYSKLLKNMRNNKVFLCGVIFSITLLYSCKNKSEKVTESAEKEWVQLFNGKNLNDWTVKIKGHALNENYKNTFRVVDGVIQVNYDEYETFGTSFGHLFYKNEFSNYKFRLEYRFTGNQLKGGAGWAKRNSGVMIHCQNPESMGLEQDFPVSVEVQLLGGLGTDERSTGNVCTPGTHIVLKEDTVTKHCINSTSKTFHGDQWVSLEIVVLNDSIISHAINGEKVLTYYKPQIGGPVDFDEELWKSKEGNPLKKGFISLQSESHPIEFRNIEIFELN